MRMQVPFESLKRAAKEKKASLDEVSSIAKMLDIQNAAATTAAEQLEILSEMAVRLQNLKRKVAVIFKQYRNFCSWQKVTLIATCCSLKKAVRKNMLML